MEPWRRELRHGDARPSGETELRHFGIKGMKWGVRKQEGKTLSPRQEARQAKKLTKADEKWGAKLGAPATHFNAFNYAANKMNTQEIPRLNAKYFKTDSAKATKAYYDEYSKTFADHFSKSLSDQLGGGTHSPSGAATFRIEYDVNKHLSPNVHLIDAKTKESLGSKNIDYEVAAALQR